MRFSKLSYQIPVLLLPLLIAWIILSIPKDSPQIQAVTPSPIVESPTPIPSYEPYEVNAVKLFEEVQKWRAASKQKQYETSDFTCSSAEDRVIDIQKVNNHSGFYSRYNELGFDVSENLSYGYSSEQETLAAWIASPTHRENLMKDYPYSCIRCLNNKCVHIFSVK